MTSASHILILVFAIGLFSVCIAGTYRLLELLNVRHQQRLGFIKLGLTLVWLILPTSLVLNNLVKGRAVGTLLPEANIFGHHLSSAQAVFFVGNETSRITWLLLSGYVVGVIFMLNRLATSFFQSKKLLKEAREISADGVAIYETQNITSPLSFGLLKPKIFIPTGFLENKTNRTLQIAITHEETHIANGDHRWKFISLLSGAFLFFAPTMSYLHRKFELEMEIECDDSTMKTTGATISEYGNLLLELASTIFNDHKPYSVFAHMTDSTLRRRIIAMKTKTIYRPVLTFIFGVTILAAGLGAAAGTSGVAKLKGQYSVQTESKQRF